MVAAGDTVYFELVKEMTEPSIVTVTYNGEAHSIHVEGVAYTKPKKAKKEKKMDTSNLFAVPAMNSGMGGAIGGGLGAGLLGGVLGGALLGGNNGGGLFGNRNGADAGLAGINAINMNTDSKVAASTALSEARFNAEAQRELQAAIERTAASTQLAVAVGNAALGVEVAKGQGEINTQVALTTGNLGTQNALNASATQVLVQKTAGELSTQVALGQAALGVAIEKGATASALAFKDAAIDALRSAGITNTLINADGDRTRSLIVAQYEATLNRQLATAENQIIELRGDRRLQEVGHGITISNNNNAVANAQQQQAQQQQQQISYLSSQLAALIQQNQHIQQGVLNIGSGTVSGNSQTAANTRVS
jgi:hypothetical protein